VLIRQLTSRSFGGSVACLTNAYLQIADPLKRVPRRPGDVHVSRARYFDCVSCSTRTAPNLGITSVRVPQAIAEQDPSGSPAPRQERAHLLRPPHCGFEMQVTPSASRIRRIWRDRVRTDAARGRGCG